MTPRRVCASIRAPLLSHPFRRIVCMYGSDVEALDAIEEGLRKLVALLDVDGLPAAEACDRLTRLSRCERLLSAITAKVACRVRDTNGHRARGERDPAATCATVLGVERSAASRLMDVAGRAAALPLVDAALSKGALSLRQAELIVGAAAFDPGAEQRLLAAAREGLQSLKDECLEVRRHAESDAARAARLRTLRRLSMWTDDDGMVAGRFRLTPEVGGQIRAVLDHAVQKRFRQRRAGSAHEPLEAYAADALAELVLDGANGAPGRRRADCVVEPPLQVLLTPPREDPGLQHQTQAPTRAAPARVSEAK